MSSNSSEPPQPNPLLTAYESFVNNTHFVTRILLSAQVVSYVISWFVNSVYSLGNIPLFSVQKFEIYRILLSPLVNDSFITLLFTFWSFQPLGQRLEASIGSTAFAWLCFMLAVLVNIIFILVSYFLFALTGRKPYLLAISHGMWTILFGIIALECMRAPAGTKRPFFFGAQVPVRFYPVALYLLFSFLSFDFSLAKLISIGLGYLVGFGDSAEVNSSSFYVMAIASGCSKLVLISAFRAQQWEDHYLSGVADVLPGWVERNDIVGSAAWTAENSGMTLPIVGGRPNAVGNENQFEHSSTVSADRIPESLGHTLGGTGRRSGGAVDDRTARLQAIERRQLEQQQQHTEPNQ